MDATQAAYAYQQQQNKGTLVPGQTISVNKYTVQVERYLSQGGFAHVYLVRTAQPVYNTTHHVLKRIAVANEAMLTDVKKEVDIMRLLKGHPNIVHLIDAAWHRMSNGLYEVFILMEYCPGGGIIDMMNRRLRERLTEAEILQIFVDVCEGVAYMHNSRPPLLHRDLKVENILQASQTSFKLCDFGSATTVATRPPSNMQEVRALEEDLNRHTTLQYRAPEMIDPHLRRPIDEKSDVWALGVLLYKLCYYTTPFEEHGPLAILNVQYRIPPYPVYSAQMNALIASMLREHGTQRPSVFELLVQVHRLRGTKSQFQYNIPAPQPLAPRVQQPPFKSPSPNPVQSTISYRQAPAVAANVNGMNAVTSASQSSLSKNAGIQARDKVLEAIAPMRRGRPAVSKESSRSSSPAKTTESAKENNWLDDEEKAWQAVTTKSARTDKPQSDAWSVGADRADPSAAKKGFGDDFGEQLWRSTNPNAQPAANVMKPTVSPTTLKAPATDRPVLSRRISDQPIKPAVRTGPQKDAFDGLGFSVNEKPAPTLAEARKLRTGLAISANQYSSSGKYASPSPASSGLSPSPRPTYTSSSPSGQQSLVPPLKANLSGSSWSSQPPSSRPSSSQPLSPETVAAESKFPSLEELDASFASKPQHGRQQSISSIKHNLHAPSEPQLPNRPPVASKPSAGSSNPPRPGPSSGSTFRSDGVRSEQVSGIAMRSGVSSPSVDASQATKTPNSSSSVLRGHSIRRHRSSVSMKTTQDRNDSYSYNQSLTSAPSKTNTTPSSEITPRLPPRPTQQREQRDWLTGDDDPQEMSSTVATRTPVKDTSQPVLRDSPSKRASYIEKSPLSIQPRAVTPESLPLPSPATQGPESPSRRAHRVFPQLEHTTEPIRDERLTEKWSSFNAPVSAPQYTKEPDTASSADEEGPEDVGMSVAKKRSRKGRQSSVHDLVDLWGGGTPGGGSRIASPEKKRDAPQSHNQKESATRSTVTPLPRRDSVAKRRSLATPAIPTQIRRRSISPQPVASPSSSRPPGTPASMHSQHSQHSNVASPTSATSSRSRPQSMFIFPTSKSNPSSSEAPGSSPLSAGLSPPEVPQPARATRRTSITDMVQKYEAIDAVARGATPVSRSVSQKLPAASGLPENATGASMTSNRDGQINGKSGGGAVDDSQLNTPTKNRSTSSGIPRPSPSKFSSSAASITTSEETATPRARRLSTKPEPASSAATQQAFPLTRKPTLPLDEQQQQLGTGDRSGDIRSPSPERPYQGVGKLIDQWQRKTAESEATRTPAPKRGGGGLVAKQRAALVNGTNP